MGICFWSIAKLTWTQVVVPCGSRVDAKSIFFQDWGTFMLWSVLSSCFLLLFGLAEAKLKNSPKCSKETLELFIFQMIFFSNCLIFWKASNWSIARINTAITVGEGQIWGLHISLVRSGFKFNWQLCYTFASCLVLSLLVFCKVPPPVTLSLEYHVPCWLTNAVSNWVILELMQHRENSMGNLTESLEW